MILPIFAHVVLSLWLRISSVRLEEIGHMVSKIAQCRHVGRHCVVSEHPLMTCPSHLPNTGMGSCPLCAQNIFDHS